MTAASAADPFDQLAVNDKPRAPRVTFAENLRLRLDTALNALTEPGGSVAHLFYFTIPAPNGAESHRFWSGLFPGWQLDQGDAGWHIEGVVPPGGINTGTIDNSARYTSPSVWITVDDIHEAVARVRALGGSAEDPVVYDSGASADCTDDQGTRFNLSVPAAEYRSEPASGSRHGELFYWSLPVADGHRGRQFYGELFGWEFDDEGAGGGIHVANMIPDGGLGAGRAGDAPDLFFRVDDVAVAAARVVELGGTASDPMQGLEGTHVMCTDSQGVPFGLSQPAPGY